MEQNGQLLILVDINKIYTVYYALEFWFKILADKDKIQGRPHADTILPLPATNQTVRPTAVLMTSVSFVQLLHPELAPLICSLFLNPLFLSTTSFFRGVPTSSKIDAAARIDYHHQDRTCYCGPPKEPYYSPPTKQKLGWPRTT
jgi:hypothetical protein